ncbi:MAG: hypothetical protein ABI398_11375 [Devosia sp.]
MPGDDRPKPDTTARTAVLVVGVLIVLAAVLGLANGTIKVGMPVPTPHDPITVP